MSCLSGPGASLYVQKNFCRRKERERAPQLEDGEKKEMMKIFKKGSYKLKEEEKPPSSNKTILYLGAN